MGTEVLGPAPQPQWVQHAGWGCCAHAVPFQFPSYEDYRWSRRRPRRRLSVVGCRLSVVGFLVVGCRLSVFWLSVVGCRFFGCRLSVVGCRLSVVGCSPLWMRPRPRARSSFGPWTLCLPWSRVRSHPQPRLRPSGTLLLPCPGPPFAPSPSPPHGPLLRTYGLAGGSRRVQAVTWEREHTARSSLTTPHTLGTTPHTLGTTPHTLGTTPSTLGITPHTLGTTPHTLGTTPHILGTTP